MTANGIIFGVFGVDENTAAPMGTGQLIHSDWYTAAAVTLYWSGLFSSPWNCGDSM
jgi:hypothetical protein